MTGPPAGELDAARQVADAVLYEGYLLYPYRSSSSKNQVRWQFGVLGPQGAEAAGAGEAASIYVDFLVEAVGAQAAIDLHVRFLQTQWRGVEGVAADGRFEPVEELRIGETNWICWHEAVEQEVVVEGIRLADLSDGTDLSNGTGVVEVGVLGGEETEVLLDGGTTVGRLVRTRWPLTVRLELSAEQSTDAGGLVKLTARLTNTATWAEDGSEPRATRRDLAARHSLVGTHLLVVGRDSRMVSLVDPPPRAAAVAASCGNSRCWPVLVGTADVGAQVGNIVLCSPIILGDHPQIAPESPGQLFDSAEIDEILTLRIMTLTDEEKRAARGTDPRAARIIDRSDDLPPEVFERLHGALRGLDRSQNDFAAIDDQIPTWFDELADAAVSPTTDVVMIAGSPVGRGARVRLHPRRRADAQDMFLAGLVAIVQRIDLDVDGAHHIAVLLEDDPATELHAWHGRYYYFGVEELEPLADSSIRTTS